MGRVPAVAASFSAASSLATTHASALTPAPLTTTVSAALPAAGGDGALTPAGLPLDGELPSMRRLRLAA